MNNGSGEKYETDSRETGEGSDQCNVQSGDEIDDQADRKASYEDDRKAVDQASPVRSEARGTTKDRAQVQS